MFLKILLVKELCALCGKIYPSFVISNRHKKRPSAQRRSFYILTQTILNSYFKSFKSAIASVAFDNCAYFKAVYPFSFLSEGRAPLANKNLMISTLL